jgi:hypothetical protein
VLLKCPRCRGDLGISNIRYIAAFWWEGKGIHDNSISGFLNRGVFHHPALIADEIHVKRLRDITNALEFIYLKLLALCLQRSFILCYTE